MTHLIMPAVPDEEMLAAAEKHGCRISEEDGIAYPDFDSAYRAMVEVVYKRNKQGQEDLAITKSRLEKLPPHITAWPFSTSFIYDRPGLGG